MILFLAQATTSVPWSTVPPWLAGFVGFLAVVLLALMVVNQGKKVFGRRPPIDNELKNLRSEIYRAKNSIKKDVAAALASERELTEALESRINDALAAEKLRIDKLEELYREMQLDRERKWGELKESYHTLETTMAFIRGKFEQEDRLAPGASTKI